MGLGCGTTLVKYILFIFNFLIALGGIALVVIGALALSQASDLKGAFTEDDPTFAAIVLIVFGGIVFLISFFGCCGAIRESYCMVMTYASVLFVIFVAQVAIAAFVLVNHTDFQTRIVKAIGKVWENPSAPGNQQVIEGIQNTFDCCGWSGFSFNQLLSSGKCLTELRDVDCRVKFENFIETQSVLLGWVAIGVAAVQLVALIFACCLGNNVRNAQRRYA